MCFLIYGVKSKSGHDWSQSFCLISHVSGPENKWFYKNDAFATKNWKGVISGESEKEKQILLGST